MIIKNKYKCERDMTKLEEIEFRLTELEKDYAEFKKQTIGRLDPIDTGHGDY